MTKFLPKWLLKILSDTHNAIVSIVVASLLAGTSMLLLLKSLRDATLQALLFPMPLWATIGLVVLGCLLTKTILCRTSKTPDLPLLQIKILELLSKFPDGVISEKLIAAISVLEKQPEETAATVIMFHLRELESLRMVIVSNNKWSIIHEGARYLVEHP